MQTLIKRTRRTNLQISAICSNNSFRVIFCWYLCFLSQNKIFNICSFFQPANLLLASPPGRRGTDHNFKFSFRLQNLVMYFVSVWIVFYWIFFMISIERLGFMNIKWKWNFLDLFFFFEPGENSKGTIFFSPLGKFSRGTDILRNSSLSVVD